MDHLSFAEPVSVRTALDERWGIRIIAGDGSVGPVQGSFSTREEAQAECDRLNTR